MTGALGAISGVQDRDGEVDLLGRSSVERMEVGMVSRVGVASEDFRKQVLGYGLTTAHILYRMPDHPSLLQTYVWQSYDLFPKFPALQDFLAFWQEKLDGPLYSVTVAHSRLIKPAELRAIDGIFRLHLSKAWPEARERRAHQAW
jgi:uncharacterized protein Usg